MKIRLLLAYDGPSFRGWQSQRCGGAVQDVLESVMAEIIGERVILHGSGRTDAGVHALAQTAHFELSPLQLARMGRMGEPARWVAALNASLPHEIRVLKAVRASKIFHSRFSASGKIYRYELWHAPVLPPRLYQRAWHLYGALDRPVIRRLAGVVEGTHDFRGFCADSGSLPEDTVRTLRRVRFQEQGPAISITLEGNGFLYRMARMIVGGMIRVAQGKDGVDAFSDRLFAARPWPNPAMAPAEGLYLVKVLYPKPGEKPAAHAA
jgi:tRNA pseudouridine38-40 synthase